MLYGFKDEKSYKQVKKYLGSPPCENCLVRGSCFDMVTNPLNGDYEPQFVKSCRKAREWFFYGVFFANWIDFLIDDAKNNINILHESPEKIMEALKKMPRAYGIPSKVVEQYIGK